MARGVPVAARIGLADHDRSNIYKVGQRAAIESRGRYLLALETARPPDRLALDRARARELGGASDREPENATLRLDAAVAALRLAEVSGGDTDRSNETRSALDEALQRLGDDDDDRRDLRSRSLRAQAWEARARIGSDRAAADRAVALARAVEQGDRAYAFDLAAALATRARLAPSAEDQVAALGALRAALAAGFDNAHRLRTDPRFATLRGSAGFPALSAVPDSPPDAPSPDFCCLESRAWSPLWGPPRWHSHTKSLGHG